MDPVVRIYQRYNGSCSVVLRTTSARPRNVRRVIHTCPHACPHGESAGQGRSDKESFTATCGAAIHTTYPMEVPRAKRSLHRSSGPRRGPVPRGDRRGGVRVLARTVEDVRRIARSDSRVPPQDTAAEESVLGAMRLSREAIAAVIEPLKAGDFYRSGPPEDRRGGPGALREGRARRRRPPPTSCSTCAGDLQPDGGAPYLRACSSRCPSPPAHCCTQRIVAETLCSAASSPRRPRS